LSRDLHFGFDGRRGGNRNVNYTTPIFAQ